jgi:hypothetical protein
MQNLRLSSEERSLTIRLFNLNVSIPCEWAKDGRTNAAYLRHTNNEYSGSRWTCVGIAWLRCQSFVKDVWGASQQKAYCSKTQIQFEQNVKLFCVKIELHFRLKTTNRVAICTKIHLGIYAVLYMFQHNFLVCRRCSTNRRWCSAQ